MKAKLKWLKKREGNENVVWKVVTDEGRRQSHFYRDDSQCSFLHKLPLPLHLSLSILLYPTHSHAHIIPKQHSWQLCWTLLFLSLVFKVVLFFVGLLLVCLNLKLIFIKTIQITICLPSITWPSSKFNAVTSFIFCLFQVTK